MTMFEEYFSPFSRKEYGRDDYIPTVLCEGCGERLLREEAIEDQDKFYHPWCFEGGEMTCPKCGAKMTIGTSHDDRGKYQWECHHCGYIKVIYEKEE